MGHLVQAIRTLLLAALILVGLPLALIHFVGWPLPRTMPDPATLRDWIDHPFAGMRFWHGVAILFWVGWTAVIGYLGIALLAQLGRVRPPRIRIRPLQGLAAGMVGASVATVTSGTGHAAPPAAVATASTPTIDPAAVADTAAGPSYLVERGDWLSAIAARFLGDPDAHPRIQALNPDLAARDTRFPNHIEPGWRIHLPADAHDHGIRLHAAGTLIGAPAAQDAQPGPSPAADAAPLSTPEQPAASSMLDDDEPDVVVGQHATGVMAGAGLISAMLLALLTAERRRQRGYLLPGQDPPVPRDRRAERELRIAQLPADVERLDAALRDLSRSLDQRANLPDIVGVRLVGRDVHVLLAQPDEQPPPPWLDEGTQWALPGYLDPEPTTHPANLLPLLVTVGSRAGRHLHLDLHRLGTLSITGHPYRARDLLRHIVCELACAPWAEQVSILLAGFGDEGEALLDIQPARLRPLPTLTEAITTLRTELHRRTDLHGRTDPTAATPALVLAVANPTAAERAELGTLHRELVAAGQAGVAVVVCTADHDPIAAARLGVGEDGTVRVEVPGLRLSTDAASVPVDMLEPLAQVLRTARLTLPTQRTAPDANTDATEESTSLDPAAGVLALFDAAAMPPATPDRPAAATSATAAMAQLRRDDVDLALDADVAAWFDADPTRPRIAILGPIRASMPGQITDSKHRLYTEMLLYLLTRPDRSTDRAQLENALWYGHPAGEGTIRAAMTRLRRWLGSRPGTGEWISEGNLPEGTYTAADAILLDWHLLQRLRDRGDRRGEDGAADYRRALQLVRGPAMQDRPDSGRYRRPYTWIDGSDINPVRIMAAVTDIAHRLASHSLDIGDTDTARWAVQQGWLADPDRSYDELWLDHMRAEHHDGRTAALHSLVEQFRRERGAEVLEDLQPRTYKAIHDLLRDNP